MPEHSSPLMLAATNLDSDSNNSSLSHEGSPPFSFVWLNQPLSMSGSLSNLKGNMLSF